MISASLELSVKVLSTFNSNKTNGATHTYNFDNCYFGKLQYGYFRPYGGSGTNVVNLNNCTFSNNYDGINPKTGVTVNISNSKYEDGVDLTESIVATSGANGKVYLDGTLIFDSSN